MAEPPAATVTSAAVARAHADRERGPLDADNVGREVRASDQRQISDAVASQQRRLPIPLPEPDAQRLDPQAPFLVAVGAAAVGSKVQRCADAITFQGRGVSQLLGDTLESSK